MLEANIDFMSHRQVVQYGPFDILMTQGKERLKGTASVRLQLTPRPRVVFSIQPSGTLRKQNELLAISGSLRLNAPTEQITTDVLVTKLKHSSKQRNLDTEVVPKQEPLPMGSSRARIKRAKFFIFNLWDYLAIEESIRSQKRQNQRWTKTLLITTDRWLIEIGPHSATAPVLSQLEESGGFGLTHGGLIERRDGKTFSPRELIALLDCLHYFLSFARGFWVSTGIVIGLNQRGRPNWNLLGSWATDHWFTSSPYSWCDKHHANSLCDLFPNFLDLWTDSLWNKPIRGILYWYMRSNTQAAGTDGSIVLSQAALELFSWTYAVHFKKLISADGFKRLAAADRLRLLFATLDLPLGLPVEASQLRKSAKTFNWTDGAAALTEIRNGIVHPDRKSRGLAGDGLFEAWNLAQWYIELTLLRMLQYTGMYANRCRPNRWVGEVETVPFEVKS